MPEAAQTVLRGALLALRVLGADGAVGFAGVLILAFWLRAYTGFGSSLVGAAGLTLLLPAAQVVPLLFALEVLASLTLLPGALPQVHWQSLGWAAGVSVVVTPLGVLLLKDAPARPMGLVVSSAVLLAVIVLWRRPRRSAPPGPWAAVSAGAIAGLLGGAASINGPPMVLYYLARGDAPAVARASLIAFFLLTDTLALLWAALLGLLTAQVLGMLLLALPAMLAGSLIGAWGFRRAPPALFRHVALAALLLLGLAGVLRAIWP